MVRVDWGGNNSVVLLAGEWRVVRAMCPAAYMCAGGVETGYRWRRAAATETRSIGSGLTTVQEGPELGSGCT